MKLKIYQIGQGTQYRGFKTKPSVMFTRHGFPHFRGFDKLRITRFRVRRLCIT